MQSEYTRPHQIIKVDQREIYIDAVWAVAFVARDKGLVHMATYTGDLNGEKFTEFATEAQRKIGNQRYALFLDGAPYYRSYLLKAQLDASSSNRIMNVPYSPQFNAIEGCFGIVKNHFKRKRLNAMMNNEHLVVQRLVHESFRQLTVAKVNSMIDRSEMELLGDDDKVKPMA